MHVTSQADIPDMIHLGDLTEGAICRNILLRYFKDKIYVNLHSNFSSIKLFQLIIFRLILDQF